MGFLFKDRKKENKPAAEETAIKPPAQSPLKPVEPPATTGAAPGPAASHQPHTLGELKASGYRPIPIREEMRRNLIALIKAKKPIFNGIIGYDSTVIPQV